MVLVMPSIESSTTRGTSATLSILCPRGHHEGRDGRRGQGRDDGVALLAHIDLPVPLAPGLGRGVHVSSTAHVSEGSLSGAVGSTSRDTRDTTDGPFRFPTTRRRSGVRPSSSRHRAACGSWRRWYEPSGRYQNGSGPRKPQGARPEGACACADDSSEVDSQERRFRGRAARFAGRAQRSLRQMT